MAPLTARDVRCFPREAGEDRRVSPEMNHP